MSGSAKHWALKEYKQRGEHLKRKEEMSEYKSPINVTFEDISNEVINGYDDAIICKVKKITGIDVDKKRLINALLLDKKLVRCKDCKYWHEHYIADSTCCWYWSEWSMACIMPTDPDDFCSRGVKR